MKETEKRLPARLYPIATSSTCATARRGTRRCDVVSRASGGRIDVVANNAGVAAGRRADRGLRPTEIDRIVDVNLRGVHLRRPGLASVAQADRAGQLPAQHRQRGRVLRRAGDRGLFGDQVRGARVDRSARRRMGRGRHPRPLADAELHRHAAARPPAERAAEPRCAQLVLQMGREINPPARWPRRRGRRSTARSCTGWSARPRGDRLAFGMRAGCPGRCARPSREMMAASPRGEGWRVRPARRSPRPWRCRAGDKPPASWVVRVISTRL